LFSVSLLLVAKSDAMMRCDKVKDLIAEGIALELLPPIKDLGFGTFITVHDNECANSQYGLECSCRPCVYGMRGDNGHFFAVRDMRTK
jgi:hypothetical protein